MNFYPDTFVGFLYSLFYVKLVVRYVSQKMDV